MCQVGESSKVAGSGKIGRKGIGFKSVFQICDRPVVTTFVTIDEFYIKTDELCVENDGL